MIRYGLDKLAFKNLNKERSISELESFIKNFRLYQRDDDAGLVIEDGVVTAIEISA